jgi:hypothetical protein
MSQILAIRGEVRNHPLTFEFAIEYNKGVGSRRTAPAQGIETHDEKELGEDILSRRTAPAQGIETLSDGGTLPLPGWSRRTAPAQGIETRVGVSRRTAPAQRSGAPLANSVTKDRPCAGELCHEGPPLRRGLKHKIRHANNSNHESQISHEGPPLRRGLKPKPFAVAAFAQSVTKDRPCAGD